MKIIVLHGDDTLKSYERLQHFVDIAKGRLWDVRRITEDSQSLQQILLSPSLFEKQKMVVVENTRILDKPTVEWISKEGDSLENTLIIYHSSILGQRLLKSIKKIDKIEEFSLPKQIWNFLDSFYPGNAKNVLILLHKVLQTTPVEFVFTLLARHMRDVYWAKKDPKGVSLPSWRVSKLQRQASRYPPEKLAKIIEALADADMAAKTSQDSLSDLLDFIIASQLK